MMDFHDFKVFVRLTLFMALATSCKKEAKYDSAPVSATTYSFTFSPEAAGTLTTNFSGTNPKLTFKNLFPRDPLNFMYGVDAFFWRKYFNTAISLNKEFEYALRIRFTLNERLKAQPYNYTATVAKPTPAKIYWKNGYGTEYSWDGYAKNASAAYYTYADSYTKISINKMYILHQEDGDHTYADGSIDATMAGNTGINENGNNFSFVTQLHFTSQFTGAEIIE